MTRRHNSQKIFTRSGSEEVPRWRDRSKWGRILCIEHRWSRHKLSEARNTHKTINMEWYFPYSQRNKIKDPELAWLLDFCERIMWWDIDDHWYEDLLHSFGSWIRWIKVNIWFDGETQILVTHGYEEKSIRLPTELFYKTYKYILPIIRDTYK